MPTPMETPTPLPPEAPPAEAPPVEPHTQVQEQLRKPEVPKERQNIEISRVARTPLAHRGRQFDGMSKEEINAALSSADAADAAMYSLHRLNSAQAGEDWRSDGGLAASDGYGKPLQVEVNGQQVMIEKVYRFDGANFICLEQVRSGRGGDVVEVPKAELIRAQLVAISDVLLSSTQLSSAEKEALSLYVALAKGEDIQQGRAPGVIDEIVLKAAREGGVLTTDDLRTFIDRQVEGMEGAEGEVLKQELYTMLEGKNLADYGTTAAVLARLGFGGKKLQEGGGVERHFLETEAGLVDKGKALEVREAIRKGDAKAAFGIEYGQNLGNVDAVITQQIEAIEKEIAELEAANKDAKRLRKLLGDLRLAQTGEGDEGVVLKMYGIKSLLNEKSFAQVEGLQEASQAIVPEFNKAWGRILTYLEASGISREELINLHNEGVNGIERLLKSGRLLKDKSLETMLFGKEMDQKELSELMKGTNLTPEQEELLRRYGKKGGLGVLLLLLLSTMGVGEAMKDLTSGR